MFESIIIYFIVFNPSKCMSSILLGTHALLNGTSILQPPFYLSILATKG